MFQEATGETESEQKPVKEFDAKALGRKGGKARAEKLSPERRSEMAKKAAQDRWQTKA